MRNASKTGQMRRLEPIALVLSGGVGLGAYQAGAYACFQNRGLSCRWIAASSVGAVNAVLIAGNPPEARISALQTFWMAGGDLLSDPFRPFVMTPFRQAQNWMKVIGTRLFGARGHFRPRLFDQAFQPFSSLYDLSRCGNASKNWSISTG
jgi:NTE family protein